MADFQILHSCPNCLIEGVLVESYKENSDTIESCTCSFCQYDSKTNSGISFVDPNETLEYLNQWMKQEGGTNLEHFCDMNFYGSSAESVVQRLINKQPIESSFDVLEYLFPGFGGGGISVTTDEEEEIWDEPQFTEEAYTHTPDESIPVVARALAAVMLADGEWVEQEENLIQQILSDLNLEQLQEADRHGWMPVDLPIPKEPELLVRKMLDIAFVDEELDESEWRVIKEFARYWGCDRKELQAERDRRIGPPKSIFFRLWNSLQTLLFQENV